jgi:hypothetical protein
LTLSLLCTLGATYLAPGSRYLIRASQAETLTDRDDLAEGP